MKKKVLAMISGLIICSVISVPVFAESSIDPIVLNDSVGEEIVELEVDDIVIDEALAIENDEQADEIITAEALEWTGYTPLTQASIDGAGSDSSADIYIGPDRFGNDTLYLNSAKYYLKEDINININKTIWECAKDGSEDAVLDLNGHNLTFSENAVFECGNYYNYIGTIKYNKNFELKDSKKTGTISVGDSYGLQISAYEDQINKLTDVKVKGKVAISLKSSSGYTGKTVIDGCYFARRDGDDTKTGNFGGGGSFEVSNSTFNNAADFTGGSATGARQLNIKKGCTFGNQNLHKGASGMTAALSVQKYDKFIIGEENGSDSDVKMLGYDKTPAAHWNVETIEMNHFTMGNTNTINIAHIYLNGVNPNNFADGFIFRSGTVYAPYKKTSLSTTDTSGYDDTSYYGMYIRFQYNNKLYTVDQLKEVFNNVFKTYSGKAEVLPNTRHIALSGMDSTTHFIQGRNESMHDNFGLQTGNLSDTGDGKGDGESGNNGGSSESTNLVKLTDKKGNEVSATITINAKDSTGTKGLSVDLTDKMKVDTKKNVVTFASSKNMPKVEGYTFKGWYDQNKKKVSKISVKKLKDITVTATYVENTYNLTYKLVKPKGTKTNAKPVNKKKVKYSEIIAIDATAITAETKTGEKYTLIGWASQKGAQTPEYALGQTTSKLGGKEKKDKKVTLYPVWKIAN